MRSSKMLFVTIAALVLSFAAAHADGNKKDDCDEKCQAYKHGTHTGLKPPIRNQVCFRFQQPQADEVVLMVYASYEPASKTGTITRQLKRRFGTTGQFCLGSKWVEDAAYIEICDKTARSGRGRPTLSQGLVTGVVDLCLMGKSCPRYVAVQ